MKNFVRISGQNVSAQLRMHSPESTCCVPSGDCDTCTGAVDNPLKLRECAIKREGGSSTKSHKMCCYQNCPAPMQTKKWRTVTPGTTAGGRDWTLLLNQTLCDSCYSTYRKHGTFARSQRCANGGGWSRVRVDMMSAKPESVALSLERSEDTPSLKRSGMENASCGRASKRQCAPLRVDLGDVENPQDEDGSVGTPRLSISRTRKPSEKMKGVAPRTTISTNARITRPGKLNDGIPEMFNMAPIGYDDAGDQELMLEPMSSCDLGFRSSEMGWFANLLGLEDEFLRISSSSDEDLVDPCLD